jgi:hypothetical protein
MVAQIQTQPQPQQPQFPTLSPYAWQDIGIIGFVVVSFAIAFGKWLPDHLNQRWEVRKKEIEQAIALQEQSMKAELLHKEQSVKAELLRDERDQKLLADFTNTLLAKELQRSEELLENLAETQQRIAETQGIQQQQFEAISRGFEQSTQNQARMIELHEAILEALSK